MKTKNLIEVTKPEGMVIDILSYVGEFGDNNPNKGMYSKEEVETVVNDIIHQYINSDILIDDSNIFSNADYAFDLMTEYDELNYLKEELTNRIYEGLNDLYNPYPDKLWTVRKGLNLKDDDDKSELLCDIENEYLNYIIEESGAFNEEMGDEEGAVEWSVKDVIDQIYTKIIEALHIQ